MVAEYLTFRFRQGLQRVGVKELFGYLLDNPPPPFQTLKTSRFTPTRSKNKEAWNSLILELSSNNLTSPNLSVAALPSKIIKTSSLFRV